MVRKQSHDLHPNSHPSPGIVMSAFENAHKFVHDIPASQKAGISGLTEAVAKAAELGIPTDEVSLKKVIASAGINAASAQGGGRVSVDW